VHEQAEAAGVSQHVHSSCGQPDPIRVEALEWDLERGLQPVVLPAHNESASPAWDYLLFPRARWGAVPGPIVSQGGAVIGHSSGQLLAAIRRLLR